MTPDMGNTWVQSAGSMTLYMELYNSATSGLLARVIDPRNDPGMMGGWAGLPIAFEQGCCGSHHQSLGGSAGEGPG